MKERPILFSGPMVRAILDGRKTQTRRVIKPTQPRDDGMWPAGRNPVPDCPYGRPGDRLWVRETWGISLCGNRVSLSPEAWPDGWPVDRLRYAADGYDFGLSTKRPSIHMPRWASRITLEITDIRVQRLRDISEDDAVAEGIEYGQSDGATSNGRNRCFVNPVSPNEEGTAQWAFSQLWDSINAERAPWASNPWVWAVSFKRINNG